MIAPLRLRQFICSSRWTTKQATNLSLSLSSTQHLSSLRLQFSSQCRTSSNIVGSLQMANRRLRFQYRTEAVKGYKKSPFTKSSRPRQRKPETNSKKPLLKALSELTPRENIYTIPNILTFSRLFAAPLIGYLVLHDYHTWAVALFAYAGITDLVDGYIARRWNLQTVVGTVIDPMADKALMTILTVCLAVKGALPVWLATIILGRDVLLGIAAIYYRWISLPPPKTFIRYWDFSLPSAEVHPTTISKYNTALQLALIGATTAMPLLTVDVGNAMIGLQYVVASTTVASGLSYIFSKDAVKILRPKEPGSEERKGKEGK